MLFGIIVLPLTMLGCIYYPWQALAAVPWLQKLVLLNPLVYMCEGFRAALTEGQHMSLWAVYPAMIGFRRCSCGPASPGSASASSPDDRAASRRSAERDVRPVFISGQSG